jgi:hypothetical protein
MRTELAPTRVAYREPGISSTLQLPSHISLHVGKQKLANMAHRVSTQWRRPVKGRWWYDGDKMDWELAMQICTNAWFIGEQLRDGASSASILRTYPASYFTGIYSSKVQTAGPQSALIQHTCCTKLPNPRHLLHASKVCKHGQTHAYIITRWNKEEEH